MYSLENKLYDQLCFLRDQFGLKGVKAEFEAEGSSLRDLFRLRRLSDKAGVGLYLKIGGVEAVRDIKDSAEIGVDGLIAPMVESVFGAKKFIDSYSKIYKSKRIHLSINIETKNGIDAHESIITYLKNKIDNVTVGRSDLSNSYFDSTITPDSDVVFKMIAAVSKCASDNAMTCTVGGSVSRKTVEYLKGCSEVREAIYKLETRKVILPTEMMLMDEAINQVLRFEELYILSKKEFSDLFIESEISRLTQLKGRQ